MPVANKITVTLTQFEAAAIDRAIFDAIFSIQDDNDGSVPNWENATVQAMRRAQQKIYKEIRNGR